VPNPAAERSEYRAGEHALATRRLLRLSYVGFVSLGLPDTVLGAAWPAMRSELGLPLDAGGALLLCATVGVVISSSASSWLREHIGTGRVLTCSTLLAGLSLLATALSQHWTQLLAAALLAGLGGGAIDASLNDHVARHHSARHLSWLHACWGIGAAAAPLVVATVLASANSWRFAYAALALVEALLAIAFLRTSTLWSELAAREPTERTNAERGLRWPMLASVALFYVYGGLEASAGLWSSSLLIDTRQVSPALASAAVALFWAALTVGRIAVGLRADVIGPARVLRSATWLALLACFALALPNTAAWFAACALTAVGLSLAPIYPLAMHDTPTRFGERWGTRLVGYQVASASLGVATLPWLLGAVARRSSLAILPALFALLAVSMVLLRRARDYEGFKAEREDGD
jgi:fucose permease